ncbi:endonuclease/exonuclease/phosphatase family protein [Enterococcus gallinarum]|uniref:endonuclease/exonuclease/phosphatase family protein n=1 Tax=Enterococcus gallinarum TaxID=1353 RepID=UPI0035DF476A
MTNIKILEWNINQRSSEDSKFPNYVISEISQKNPDVIVLVEFKGKENKFRLDNSFSEDYFTYSYNGSKYTNNKNDVKRGNGIYIALKKSIFNESSLEDVSWEEDFENNQPNWLKIKSSIKTGQELTIIGTRIRVGSKKRKDELISRKSQINWLLKENKHFNNQIIIGDLNYSPSEVDWCKKEELNWQDIIYMMRDEKYLNCNQYSPYSPFGTSWKWKRLDWMISKGVSIDYNSKYNQLDWSFGKNNNSSYLEGYMVPEGYFIINEPPYPDHAIFTTEIIL